MTWRSLGESNPCFSLERATSSDRSRRLSRPACYQRPPPPRVFGVRPVPCWGRRVSGSTREIRRLAPHVVYFPTTPGMPKVCATSRRSTFPPSAMRVRWLKAVAQFSPQYQLTSRKEGERGRAEYPQIRCPSEHFGDQRRSIHIGVLAEIADWICRREIRDWHTLPLGPVFIGPHQSVGDDPYLPPAGKIDIHGLNIGSAKRRIQIWRPTEPVPNSVHRVMGRMALWIDWQRIAAKLPQGISYWPRYQLSALRLSDRLDGTAG